MIDLQSKNSASLVVDVLQKHGVKVVFAITGAGNLALLDEIHQHGNIKVVFMHHEQAAVMAAQGYARVNEKLGVAIVTTGGGTANAMTGILSAYLDSVPVLVISGNESSFHCNSNDELRGWGVQGFDSVSSFAKVTKVAIRLEKGMCASTIVHELIKESLNSRMGPTHLDFPMDLQRSLSCSGGCLHPTSQIEHDSRDISEESLKHLSLALTKARRPLIYIGNGCRNAATLEKLKHFLNITKFPFLLSWSAIDLFPDSHPQNMGRVGIYGERAANLALQKADLVLCLGTRLAIPQVGYDKGDFARNASIWVVDIDSTELNKFSGLRWNLIEADVEIILTKLNENLSVSRVRPDNLIQDWMTYCKSLAIQFPRTADEQVGKRNPNFVHSVDVVDYLSDNLDENAVIVTDVGAGLLSGHYAYKHKEERRFFTSQGLGEMGFGLPAAIGAYFADTSRQLVCLNTDGGIMFNLQELQTVNLWKIPIKLFIFNNDGYTMIKVSQSNLFNGREFGSSSNSGITFPNFKEMASVFKMRYLRINNLEDLNSALVDELKIHSPSIIEVIMDPEQKYFPRLGTTRMSDGSLVSPPLEDLDPKISLEALSRALEGSVHEASLRLR